MTSSSSSGASFAVVFAIGVLFGAAAACGTTRGSLRRGTEDPRAGDPVSGGQPAPPPPARSPESDPDTIERRFGHEEARARREALENRSEEADREEIVVETTPPPPPPAARRPAVTPAAYRRSNPDAGVDQRTPAAPRR